MSKNKITISQFCEIYEIPSDFIESLQSYELIEVIQAENTAYIHDEQVAQIEKFIRLHYDLNINFEGLDVIHNLLNQLETLQQEVILLKNKLQ